MNEEQKKYIDYLYRGVLAFYPMYSRDRDAIPLKSYPEYSNKKSFYTKEQFLNVVFEITGKDNLDSALQTLMDWRQEAVSASVPQNLKEIVERGKDYFEKDKQVRESVSKEVRANIQKQVELREKSQAAKTVYAVPTSRPEPVRLEAQVVEKIENSKKDLNSFVKNFVETSSKPENLPDGVDVPTAKAVALVTATELATEKLPAIRIENQEVTPLPNKLAAQVALLTEKNILENSVTLEGKEQVIKNVAISTSHDAIWREVQKKMVDDYFGQNTAKALYGDPNQTYKISEVATGGNEVLQIDINKVINDSSNIQVLLTQTPQEISTSVVDSFRKFENFPKPDVVGFSQNIGNITRGIVDLFGKPSVTEIAAPNMNQISAMRYFGVIPELNFVSPQLMSLLTRDLQLVTMKVGGLPFGLPAGQVGVNVSLLQGVGFSFTPAAAGTGAAVTTGAGVAAETAAGAAAGAAAGTTTAVATTTAAEATTAFGLGSLINPVVGVIVGLVVALLPKIQEFLKKFGNLIAGVGLALLGSGLLIGSVPVIAAGGALTGVGFASGATFSGAASGIASLFGLGISGVFAEIAAPLIGTLIGFPLLLALILFIINAGAYVVPPGGSAYGLGLNVGTTATGSCPVSGNAVISTSSYNPLSEGGHGGNAYWKIVKGTPCKWEIPITGMYSSKCLGPSSDTPNYNPDNVCSGKPAANLCPYYGFAIDVVPGDREVVGTPVYLPYLCEPGETSCPPVQWTLSNSFYNCGGSSNAGANKDECEAHKGASNGYGLIFDGVGSNGQTWRIYLTHVDPVITTDSSVTYGSGTQVAVISGDLEDGPHVHIELDQEGRPIRPDFLCSGAGISGGTISAPVSVGAEGFYVEAPITSTNVRVSPPSEYGSKTCDWANGKGLFASVNANYFDALTAPIGPAGWNGSFTNYLNSEQAKKYSIKESFTVNGNVGQIINTLSLDYETKNFNSVVTGIGFDSALEEVRPRTVLGIKGNKLLLVVLKNATPSKAKEIMQTLGAEKSFLLDGGSSSTFCQGSTPLFAGGQGGQQSTVSVNMGVKSGVLHDLTK